MNTTDPRAWIQYRPGWVEKFDHGMTVSRVFQAGFVRPGMGVGTLQEIILGDDEKISEVLDLAEQMLADSGAEIVEH